MLLPFPTRRSSDLDRAAQRASADGYSRAGLDLEAAEPGRCGHRIHPSRLRTMTAPAPTVEISAVMPAYNEAANLEQSVGRMAQALKTFTRGFEIIVVDDGSQAATAR